MKITIKGHTFGGKRPVVCVPVVEKTSEAIVGTIKKMTAQQVEMMEWRMDWYQEVEQEGAVEKLLHKISPYIKETIFLCTFRSKAQGGERELEQEKYLALNRLAAESGVVDLVDLEFYEIGNPASEIKKLQEQGVKVVCSNHNFQATPPAKEMEGQLSEMLQAGGDFAKLAVMPCEKTDVLQLMGAVLKAKEAYPEGHFVAMSMGTEGMISRLLGGWYQSEITFASFGKASAPGQADVFRVTEILKQMEECVG